MHAFVIEYSEGDKVKRIILAALLFPALTGLAQAYSGDQYKVCRLDPKGDNFLAFREGPSSRSRVIMKLGPGTLIEVRGRREKGRWFPAAAMTRSGKIVDGYVYDAYVCPDGSPLISQ